MNEDTLNWPLLLVVGCIYFLPTFWAAGHHNRPAIFLLNLLLGWTFIGWALAFVWAFTKSPANQNISHSPKDDNAPLIEYLTSGTHPLNSGEWMNERGLRPVDLLSRINIGDIVFIKPKGSEVAAFHPSFGSIGFCKYDLPRQLQPFFNDGYNIQGRIADIRTDNDNKPVEAYFRIEKALRA